MSLLSAKLPSSVFQEAVLTGFVLNVINFSLDLQDVIFLPLFPNQGCKVTHYGDQNAPIYWKKESISSN